MLHNAELINLSLLLVIVVKTLLTVMKLTEKSIGRNRGQNSLLDDYF